MQPPSSDCPYGPRHAEVERPERVMEIDPSTGVVLMTAHYSSESAVEVIKKGASDYLNCLTVDSRCPR